MFVMKFGGSSLANADRIRHVGAIIAALDENPILVLSAMGKTTDLLFAAGREACKGIVDSRLIKEGHLATMRELALDASEVMALLVELERLLEGISVIGELTPRTMDYLLSLEKDFPLASFRAILINRESKPHLMMAGRSEWSPIPILIVQSP